MKEEARFAHGIVYHLDVGPADALAKSQPNCFEKGFFGCKSNGETFGRSGLCPATVDFSFAKDTTQEEVTPAGNEVFDPFDVNDIDARSDDHNERVGGVKDSRVEGTICIVGFSLDPSTPWALESFYFMRAIISRIAWSRPTKTDRATMLCPMFSSSISLISAILRTLV